MSRWLQQGLSSLSQLREQASEFAQEVLSETKAEVEDPVASLQVAKARIAELESALATNGNEITVLRENNARLNERAQTVELQLHHIEEQRREELARVSNQTEGWTINLDSPPLAGVPINLNRDFGESSDSLPLSPTSFQFEVRKLNDEIKQLQAECMHWKQLVKQQQVGDEDPAEQIVRLCKENENLKHKLSVCYEEYQTELIELQDEHRNQLAQLTAKLASSNDGEPGKSGKGSNWDNDWETWTEQSDLNGADSQSKGVDPEEFKLLKQENFNLLTKLKDLEGQQIEPHLTDDHIQSLRQEKEALEKSLLDLDQQHQIELDQILQSKAALAATCQELRQEVDNTKSLLGQREMQVQQLESETKELSDAYNDLNDQFEKQKQESGNVVSNNRELVNRLDALKGDLVEYEEKYERCKVENEKAVRQLEMLTTEFDKLKQDLAQNRSVDDPRKWQEQVLRLSSELEDSLKKREELITNVGKFQEVVENFEEKVNRFRDDNVRLRQENAELTETLAGLGDVKQTFVETDEELSEIRRSLKEYQLTYLKKELFWRQQVENLSDENETLKKQIERLNSMKPEEHQQLNGQMVKLSETNGSNGDSSYVHVEMVADGNQQSNDIVEQLKNELNMAIEAKDQTSTVLTDERQHSQSLQELLDEKTDELNNLKIAHELLQEETGALQKELEMAQKSTVVIEQLKHELNVVIQDRDHSSTVLDDERQHVQTLEEQLNEKSSELDQLRLQHFNLQEHIGVLQKELEMLSQQTADTVRQEQQTLQEQLDEKISAYAQLQEQTGALQKELETVRTTLNQQTSDTVEQLKLELNTLIQAKEQSSSVLTAEREHSQKLQELLNKQSSELDHLKVAFAQLQEQNGSLQRELQTAINCNTNTNQQTSDVIEQLKRELNMVIQARDQSSTVLTAEREQSQNLQELLKDKSSELEHLKEVHNHLLEQTGSLQKQLEAAANANMITNQQSSDAIEQLKRELNMVIQAKDQTSTVLTAERQRSQKLQEMLNEKSSELDQLRLANAHLQERTGALQKELETAVSSSTMNNQQTSDAVEQMKRELNMVIQAKDRSSAELFAERQHSQKLQQQVNLLEDSYQKSSKETERLRQHLLQIEEAYTNEAVKSEERETTLRNRLKDLEAQLLVQLESNKDGSQQLGDQLKDMQIQLETMADQRDMALLQMADVQIELEKSQRSLANLQSVLQHFQQERDSKVFGEVENYKHEIESLKKEKVNKDKTVLELQKKLDDNHDALKAASSVIDQIALKEQMFEEVKQLLAAAEDKAALFQSQIVELQKVRDGKIDKDVLKNLLLGYFCAPTNKKPEVAHLLGSILGFTNDEFKKSESSTGGGGGWLQFLRLGSGAPQGDASRSAEQSLATQFIKFLETESTPKPAPVPMTVLDSSASGSINVSRSSTPAIPGSFRLELPSFSGSDQPLEDTRRSQSSSDFLRDVLKTSSENV